MPTLTVAAIVQNALAGPLLAMGVSAEFRAQMIEGDIHQTSWSPQAAAEGSWPKASHWDIRER